MSNQLILRRLFDKAVCCDCLHAFGDQIHFLQADRMLESGQQAWSAICDYCFPAFVLAIECGPGRLAIRRKGTEPKLVIVDHTGNGFDYLGTATLAKVVGNGLASIKTHHRNESLEHVA